MSRLATVNYHVHSQQRQAFQIDAGGIAGKLISPELVPTQIELTDLRGSERSVSFPNDGLAFRQIPTQVTSFDGDKSWTEAYNEEIERLLRAELAAKEVIVFDHTLRIDGPEIVRAPARNAHNDYSPTGAQKRLDKLLGPSTATQWRQGHYAFVNVWRPVETPIYSAPLGFVRPSSVTPGDWMPIDLVYPHRRGEIMGLATNPNHQWVYMSQMAPDEVAFFNVYDSQGQPPVGHSALDLGDGNLEKRVRKSLESRTLVRY